MRKLIVWAIIILTLFGCATAEEEAWVLCTPGSSVNVRKSPTRHSESISRLEAGDYVELTGKKRGRWYQCDVMCEAGMGWVRGDYLVFDKPTIYLKPLKCVTTVKQVWARYSIRGNKCAKLKMGTEVRVFVMSEEWSVTSHGFIMTKFLEAYE